MPRKAKTSSAPTTLPYEYEGHDVTAMNVKITKTGDGLSEPLKVDPEPGAIGATRYVLLRTITRAVDHHPTGPMAETLVRLETDVTQEAFFVDEDDVYDLLEAKRRKVADARGEPMFDDTGHLAPVPDPEAEAAWAGEPEPDPEQEPTE